MTNKPFRAIEYARQNKTRFLESLQDFIRIPSISTNPEHKLEVQRAAQWLAGYLKSMGIVDIKIHQTPRHPIITAEYRNSDLPTPTVLIYGHYDVQPPDPLAQWQTPPFEPSLRGDNLYARGASDMKGQIIAGLAAIEAVIKEGGIPLRLKFLYEGEEEIGSPSLVDFLPNHKHLLSADAILNLDAGMLAAGKPTITYGLRGLAYFELRIHGPKNDLHSGLFGGTVHNPAQALCELIAGMHDENGKVALQGFYDKVRPLDAEEHLSLSRLPVTEKSYLAQTGVRQLWGEKEYLPQERIGARPTLEVNGLLSGFTEKGTKTVIPATAMAKISTRLVPDQTPEGIYACLLQHMETHAPPTISWELINYGGGKPCMTDPNHPIALALAQALQEVWNVQPFLLREGGSIPIVSLMQQNLGMESVLSGFGLHDDNIHAPNEKLHLPTWTLGIEAVIHFFFNLKDLG